MASADAARAVADKKGPLLCVQRPSLPGFKIFEMKSASFPGFAKFSLLRQFRQ
ncbi:hypothetical protein [Bradyrhizobium japonicum]|uniref:hypothetical protein n=1 Tax=Bradyrhizobium japonicum TaxID=375 RepID=UPI000B17942C|nr:hypothetical protein [Bradyrhizobium japonicum]